MARRPATITQADIARVIRAAKQAGADSVEVINAYGDKVIVRLSPNITDDNSAPLVPTREIVL